MHITFFNRSYYPDLEATGQFLTELAEDLVRAGVSVSVVCGRSYHLEHKWGFHTFKSAIRNGVRVVRVFNTRLPKSSFASRLTNLGTYFAGCLMALPGLPRPDVVVALTDPPLLPLLAGCYARLTGARFVFAVNDLYPDVAIELKRISNRGWLRLLGFATDFGLRRADIVTVLGKDMKEKVLQKGCPPEKITVTPHWVDTDHIKPRKQNNRFRREHGFAPSDFIVMYSGNLGLSQNLENVIRAARELKELKDMHFVIIGEGANKNMLQDLSSALQLSGKVMFLPYQPKDQLDHSLSAADLHLIPLAQGVAGSIVPCKMYGIMASGTPYLAIVDRESEVARVAEQYQCGLWCQPNSPAELKERIQFAYSNRDLLSALGGNGRQAAEGAFSRKAGTDRYRALLNSIV